MNFKTIQQAVHKNWTEMSKENDQLFVVDISGDSLFEEYLAAFDETTNPIFKERTQHDCNTCKQFIRRVGNVVAINDDLTLRTVWDVSNIDESYQNIADILSNIVRSKKIVSRFFTNEPTAGVKDNNVILENGQAHTFNHFFTGKISNKFFMKKGVDKKRGLCNSNYDVFGRAMKELSKESAEIILELIDQNSLYRGKEFKGFVSEFLSDKIEYDSLPDDKKDNFIWKKDKKGIRNTSIGQLLIDLSEGKELDVAVNAFTKMVAPGNYKHTTSLVTKSMMEKAKKDLEEKGYMESLERRYMNESDLNVTNLLFKDSGKKSLGVLDDIIDTAPTSKKEQDFSKVDTVTFDKFINDILPSAKAVELFVENKHQSNLMSLITAEDKSAKTLFKWNNPDSWSYNGEMTDSGLASRVNELGGRTDGCLRFTHSWNYDKRKPNQSLMDLHVFLPGSGFTNNMRNNCHDSYPKKEFRVGWNQRKCHKFKGIQDVDFTSPPGTDIPVENITFENKNLLPDGDYYFAIHNWSLREPTKSGFKCEIALDNNVYEYEYTKPMTNKEWVIVAKATLKNGDWTIEHLIPEKSASKEIWGIETQKFVKVTHSMLSPNFWDGNNVGNKHLFFILDKCKNPSDSRGIYNEYLKPELNDIRKSLDIFGAKLRVPKSDNQLSGIGFSETSKNEFIVKVKGSFERTLKVII